MLHKEFKDTQVGLLVVAVNLKNNNNNIKLRDLLCNYGWNIYIYMWLHNKKYKRKMCYHQKNNLDVRTFERPKNIKES